MLLFQAVSENHNLTTGHDFAALRICAVLSLLCAAVYNGLMFRKHGRFGASGTILLLVIETTGCGTMLFALFRLLSGEYQDLRVEDFIYLLAGLSVAFFLFLGHTIKAFQNIKKPLPAGGEPITGSGDEDDPPQPDPPGNSAT